MIYSMKLLHLIYDCPGTLFSLAKKIGETGDQMQSNAKEGMKMHNPRLKILTGVNFTQGRNNYSVYACVYDYWVGLACKTTLHKTV